MVAIIPSSEVTLGGSRGTVPVSIDNKLQQAIQVRLRGQCRPPARCRPPRGSPSALRAAQLITIGPRQKQTVRLQVHAHSAGVTEIRLRLLTQQGAPLPGSDRTLKIRATAFGTLALVIVAVALGVLVITFVARVLRRGLREGRPGSVGRKTTERTTMDPRRRRMNSPMREAGPSQTPGSKFRRTLSRASGRRLVRRTVQRTG